MTAIYTIRFPLTGTFLANFELFEIDLLQLCLFQGTIFAHTHNSNTPQSFALTRNCPLPVPRWNVLDGTHFPWHDVVIISNLPSSISLSGHETPVTAAEIPRVWPSIQAGPSFVLFFLLLLLLLFPNPGDSPFPSPSSSRWVEKIAWKKSKFFLRKIFPSSSSRFSW